MVQSVSTAKLRQLPYGGVPQMRNSFAMHVDATSNYTENIDQLSINLMQLELEVGDGEQLKRRKSLK